VKQNGNFNFFSVKVQKISSIVSPFRVFAEFKIERHGIFVHKGLGYGYIMQNVMVIRGFRNPKLDKPEKNKSKIKVQMSKLKLLMQALKIALALLVF